MRGATAATAGSAKWGGRTSSQLPTGTQSASTKATSAVSTAASPVLRAAAGPRCTARRMTCTAAPSIVVIGAVTGTGLASSTTTTAATGPRSTSSSAGSSPLTGITTVTSAGECGPA